MGRAPCCDKASVKRGPWSPEEDATLKDYIEKHGTGGNWIALPLKAGLKRCGKSCRLRWLNYLRPNIKHGDFSDHEDGVICKLFASIGSRWSVIAAQLPGRTDNDIKNYWNTKLKKKFMAVLPPSLPQVHRAVIISQHHQARDFFFPQAPQQINSQAHHHQLPSSHTLSSFLSSSPSYPLQPAAIQSPSAHEIDFENPMQQYQINKDGYGSSITYEGCSSSGASYNVSSASSCSVANGASIDQSASYGYYPYGGLPEEKENLVFAGAGGGGDGRWTHEAVVADKTWEINFPAVVNYGLEEINQLISTGNSTCSFLLDECKVGGSVF
ncbi:hypothetical protein SAY87_019002 [Trapa incisa]|uniref:Uncharacterized protein n=1 Tax=Trapa incisa TaxID=236973 RepID=A0AAN7K326_9MYRT|nr:hypothetical protein SAY87_019002 [Trapa incisa]